MSTPTPRECWDQLVAATADAMESPTLAHELACQRALDLFMRSLGRGRPRVIVTDPERNEP